MDVFLEISLIIGITTVIAGLMRLFKQPLIIGYILAGIVVGPAVFNLVSRGETVGAFAHIGIALLLFTVGLSLNPKIIKEVGRVSLITGVGQVLFTSLVGFLLGKMLGFSDIASAYIAVALTFSSTIIIMKLLSDKGDAETLYGKIAIGFLLVQDLIVILVLMAISSFSGGVTFSSVAVGVLLKGFGLLTAVFLLAVYILPHLLKSWAKSQEFLLLFAIGWCLILASLSYYLGFSIEIGALLAGMALAISPYRWEISAKMRPLRDFFIVLFFILLGSQMVFADISRYIVPILVFSAFILIGNPLIVMILMGALGYTKRNSFLAGLTVAQISEFSLILVALGVSSGHLSSEILSFVTVVGLITIAGSTYMIIYADRLYILLSKYLGIFERKGRKVDEHKHQRRKGYEVILFGYNRIGYDILSALKRSKQKFLVVDYNPEIIQSLTKQKIDCRYGDAGDIELLEDLNLGRCQAVISTIPDKDINLLLIAKTKKASRRTMVIAVSHQIDEAIELYQAGATFVLMPHFLGGHYLASLIAKSGLRPKVFSHERAFHIKRLKQRKELGHEHPRHERY